MGGFTKVMLKDTSDENVARHNARLEIFGVSKKYRYTEPTHAAVEYEWYLADVQGMLPEGKCNYPKHMFPREQINSFEDFCRFWSTKACGECFVPPAGALTFDCYYQRMSQRAMRAVAKYLMANVEHIASVSGSFHTFMEKGMTASERTEFLAKCAPAIRQEVGRFAA